MRKNRGIRTTVRLNIETADEDRDTFSIANASSIIDSKTRRCLSIAGSDCSGGAGIQADLKTFASFGCYGMTVVTAVTAQNSVGVADTFAIPPDVIIAQLSSIFSDALPTSIKVGMLFSEEIVSAVSEFLKKNAHGIPIVVDPVMVAKSGHFLLAPKATIALKNELIPLATIVTPNLCEAAALVGIEDIRFSDQRELENYAKSILSLGAKSVFLKGGHSANETNSDDFFIDSVGNSVWMNAARITSKNTHGTGCTLSSAIAASIASGHSVTEACSNAKNYVLKAIDSARSSTVWKGHGPVDHFFWMSRTTTSSSRRSLSQASKTNR